ncbi:MAG: hypothetical protein SP1CHLAM54_08030 [Chlamydiia bacterium]|nr:hypothetical protein [Chlamydiia bacterium]MCH9615709.1 hypothetical protein [Chlamydiia bacterium]MCH9628888.1 hypothetical protein [Chlamydiia bacterium]
MSGKIYNYSDAYEIYQRFGHNQLSTLSLNELRKITGAKDFTLRQVIAMINSEKPRSARPQRNILKLWTEVSQYKSSTRGRLRDLTCRVRKFIELQRETLTASPSLSPVDFGKSQKDTLKITIIRKQVEELPKPQEEVIDYDELYSESHQEIEEDWEGVRFEDVVSIPPEIDPDLPVNL